MATQLGDNVADAINWGSNAEDANKLNQLRKYLQVSSGLRKGFEMGLLGNAILGAYEGSARSFAEAEDGRRDAYLRSLGISPEAGVLPQLAGDAARVMENVGNAMLWDLPGKLGSWIGATLATPSSEQQQQLSKLQGKL